jgi:hypothetical protein
MNHQDDPEYNDDPYKFYFQIDTEWIKKYMDNLFKNIDQLGGIEDLLKSSSLPVNSWISSIGETKPSLYLGNNYYNEGVWKAKHFVEDKLGNEYVKHLQSHAGYFLQQPKYYKGLYEILN